MWLMRLEAVHRMVMKKTEHLLAKYLSVQHNMDAVLWKQSIRLCQNAPALRSQIVVTQMTLILVFPNLLVLSHGPFVFF